MDPIQFLKVIIVPIKSISQIFLSLAKVGHQFQVQLNIATQVLRYMTMRKITQSANIYIKRLAYTWDSQQLIMIENEYMGQIHQSGNLLRLSGKFCH